MPNFRPLSETKFINDANLVSYWKFDEASGNATDSKGSNTLTNSSVSYSSAKFGNGAVTAAGGRLSISDASQTGLDFSTAFTFSWWQNKANGAYTEIAHKTDGASDRSYYIQYWGDDKIYVSISSDGSAGTNSYWVSTNAISSATGYHHWMVSYNAGTIIVTHNGENVAGAWVGTVRTSIHNSDANFVIGYYNNTALGFNIDDMACFSRALSVSEGNELYQGMTLGEYLGAGSATTKLLLHLNGNSTDSSGNGNNGTDTNITYVDGKFGKCASFNGSDSSYISFGTGFPQFTNALTVSLWCNFSQYSSRTNSLFVRGESSFRTMITTTGKAEIDINTPTLYGLSSNTVLSINTWYHLVFTYDGSNLKVYVNGKLDSTQSASGNIGSDSSNAMLGRNPTNTGRYFTGLIDETIIKNRAWSAEEVKKYYTNSLGRYATL